MADANRRSDTVDRAHRDAVARLFAQHNRWLYAYLMTLLGNPAHAEEVFQEVCVVLWRECDKFTLGTNFVSWVSVIAHHQVQKFRRQLKRDRARLSDTTLDIIAAETADRADLFELRREALSGCLEKLSERDQELVRHCYGDRRVTACAVAEELGRPSNTVYKALNRIRRGLFECITRRLAAEGIT